MLCGRDSNAAEDVKVEPLHSTDVEPESPEDQSFVVGSKCRFRHTDGRWYDGEIVGLDGSNSAKISFLTPTTENMLVSNLGLYSSAFAKLLVLISNHSSFCLLDCVYAHIILT